MNYKNTTAAKPAAAAAPIGTTVGMAPPPELVPTAPVLAALATELAPELTTDATDEPPDATVEAIDVATDPAPEVIVEAKPVPKTISIGYDL